MYTDAKQVQILIQLLKEFNVRNIVISPGTRNFPLVHSVEQDSFFCCYSVVDERSAAYFAMGIMLETGEPCAVSCTSGTASSNYHSAVCECHFQKLPLILLTADRNDIYWGQMENLMIPQVNMFGELCKLAVSIPGGSDENSLWYTYRKINEALLEMNHHGSGPIQINYVVEDGQLDQFHTSVLPTYRRIERIENDLREVWEAVVKGLIEKNKRVVINYGQSNLPDGELIREIEKFFLKTNSIISCDYTGNLHCKGVVYTGNLMDSMQWELFEEMTPELVISMNGQYMSGMKWALKGSRYQFENWSVNEEGKIIDEFRRLTKIFEMTPFEFFRIANTFLETCEDNAHEYYNAWRKKEELLHDCEFEFSNMYVIKQIQKSLPENCNLHLGNIRSVYLSQFFDMPEGVYVYAHNGTTTIDGSLSTFVGQATVSEKNSYCIIGDLSFFYDMNALWNRYLSPKMRIILINNGGGEEFYTNVAKISDRLSDFTAAGHGQSAEAWVTSVGFQYLSATNIEEFQACQSVLFEEQSEKPIFLEVFTDLEKEAAIWFDYRQKKTDILKNNVGKTELDLPMNSANDMMKLQANFDVCRGLLELSDISDALEKYMRERQIKTIALYGMGQIGNVIYKYLSDTTIEIKYVIDRRGDALGISIPVVLPDGVYEEVDAIMITVPFDNDIIEQTIRKHTKTIVISLCKIVAELNR